MSAMSTIEEKIFFRVLRLYEEKRQPGDPAADSEMRHGVCAWIRREGVGRRLLSASEKQALFTYLLENEMRFFVDMDARMMYNYFYKLEEKTALSDLSRQIFCLAREGRAIPPEQAGELKQRLYAAAAGLLDDPECSEFAQREVSESLLDLAWAGGDRSAASIRLGREL